MATKQPPKWWYKQMDEFHSKKYYRHIIDDIESNPKIKDKVRLFRKSFIKFAAFQRVNYVPDINDELREYIGKSRMYKTNTKKWYKIRMKVFKRDNFTCEYCGQVGGKLEADHIVPFSKGGSNDLNNLTTACKRCNIQKKDKTVKEFLEWKNK